MDRVRIESVEALPLDRLRVGLSQGRTVERDLSALVPAPRVENVFSPWRDPAYFAQVRLDTWPAPVWPNGEDLDLWDVDAGGNFLAPPAKKAGAS